MTLGEMQQDTVLRINGKFKAIFGSYGKALQWAYNNCKPADELTFIAQGINRTY